MKLKRQQWRQAGWIVLPFLAGILLYFFPPEQFPYYPLCPSSTFLGIHCAGCGATRAVGALVRGDVPQAFAFNPLFVLALPFLLLYFGAGLWVRWQGRPFPTRNLPAWLTWTLLVVMLLFTVLRNLPYPPFDTLAPHRLD